MSDPKPGTRVKIISLSHCYYAVPFDANIPALRKTYPNLSYVTNGRISAELIKLPYNGDESAPVDRVFALCRPGEEADKITRICNEMWALAEQNPTTNPVADQKGNKAILKPVSSSAKKIVSMKEPKQSFLGKIKSFFVS